MPKKVLQEKKRSNAFMDWESLLQECRLEDLPATLGQEAIYRGKSDEPSTCTPSSQQKLSQEFLFIPWAQILRLRTARVPVSAIFVYLSLWRLRRMRRRRTIALTAATLAPLGLTRWDKSRALAYLEAEGWLTVTRARGCNPLVTLAGDLPPAPPHERSA